MEKKLETPVCAIYVRYSGEDELEDKKGTKSLRNQKESLLEYAKQHEISVNNIYEDYFVSGTTMDRPGINQLLSDMKIGLFNVILVKDLSRFSRNYIDAGYYFEEVFPLYNIRFISVSDNYDSLYEDELLSIKNYFNTMYVKDIQKKIRKHIEITAIQKEIIKIPKYGYTKTKDGRLEIDPESASVVVKIFELANRGMNPPAIARYLTEKKIYSPQYYKRFVLDIEVNTNIDRLLENPYNWSVETIRGMIRDIEYCGHGRNIVCKGAVNEEKNILLKDVHPAIISEEYFNQTPKYYNIYNKPRERKYLHKIIRCGKCNRASSYEDSGKYSCPICHKKINAKELETFLYEDSVKLIREIMKDEKSVLDRFIKAFCSLDVTDLEKRKTEITLEIQKLISKRNDISTYSYIEKMKIYNKELTKTINEINLIKEKQISKNELTYKFNKFIKKLNIDTNQKLDVITEVIDACIISFESSDESKIIINYKFNK
jgi:DNA invertase Pin-like site-specific DNA recombinase